MSKLGRLKKILLVDQRSGDLVLEVHVRGSPAAFDDSGADTVVGHFVVVSDQTHEELSNFSFGDRRGGEEGIEDPRRGGIPGERHDSGDAEGVDAVRTRGVSRAEEVVCGRTNLDVPVDDGLMMRRIEKEPRLQENGSLSCRLSGDVFGELFVILEGG